MFVNTFSKNETPLHLAVINEDLEEVLEYGHTAMRNEKNAQGFTPLELAHFLGKEKCFAILGGGLPKKIHIRLKGEGVVSQLSHADFYRATGIKYLSFPRFDSYSLFKQAIRNCPWMLKSRFFGKENQELGVTYDTALKTGFLEGVFIQWLDEVFGYGLFANRDFPAGTYIGEYTGQVRRLYRLHPDHNAYCLHYPTCLWSWNYFTIDALAEGNYTRYINHSDPPNLAPMTLLNRGLLHQVFFTNQFVAKGEQLTFNYGKDYWKNKI